MKILYILEHYPPYIGGVETLFYELVRDIQSDGHEVRVLSCKHKERGHISFPEVIEIPTTNRYIFTFLAFFYALRWAKWADIVHTSSYNAGFPAFFAAKFYRKPVLITFHEVWLELWWLLPGLSKIQRLLFFLYEKLLLSLPFDHWIGVSTSTSNRLHDIGQSPVSTIYNGLVYEDYPSYQPQKSSSTNFLFFGRAGVSKGLDILVEATSRLHRSHPASFTLTIISGLADSRWGRQIAQRCSNWEEVTILPPQERAALLEYISQKDAVIIPSYAEGFCFAAAEACAIGSPVIHSGAGALPEVVSGKCIFYQPNEPDALYQAMIQAMAGNWKQCGSKEFPLKDTVEQYTSLYHSIL